MTSNTHRPPSDAAVQDLAPLIAGELGAALIVDPGSAEVTAANAAGLTFLGLNPATRLPYSLDGAMPAISRLRQIAAAPAAAPSREFLTFWVDGRLNRLACSARAVGNGKRALVLVSPAGAPGAIHCDRAVPALSSGHVTIASAATDDQAPAPARRDDAQTLKEIARAIREGRKNRASGEYSEEATVASKAPAAIAAPDPQTQDNPATAALVPVPLRLHPAGAPLDAGYLARLAHELKTPLSAIVAAAEIMRDQRLGQMGNTKYLGYAGDIHESASHALAVINRMLGGTAASGETEPAPTHVAAVDLNALVQAALSPMQPLAATRGLTLALDLEDGLPMVLADATALRQIVLNLVTNALKFTPRNGEVHVVTGYLDTGGIFLVVRDTGTGMDGEALTEALNDDAGPALGQRPGGGLGFGLPLVRALVAANRAELEIDSVPGKGTVVVIGFPNDRIVRT